MRNPDVIKYDQGMLFWYNDDIEDKSNGERGILRGNRPVIILSTVSNKTATCTVTCLPLTSSGSPQESNRYPEDAFFKVSIDIPGGKPSFVCCNQPMNITTNKLGTYIGQCSHDKFVAIQAEFLRYLGLIPEDIVQIRDEYIESIKADALEQPDSQPIIDQEPAPEDSSGKIDKFTFTRAVACLEDEYIFRNKAEAARYYDIDRQSIAKSIIQKKTVGVIDKTFINFK